jgi:hypothetical protein
MARKDGDGNKRKGSDKAKERYEKNGKFSNKHIRASEAIRERVVIRKQASKP